MESESKMNQELNLTPEEYRIHNDLLYYFLKTVLEKEALKIKEKFPDFLKRLFSIDLQIKFHMRFPIKHTADKVIKDWNIIITIIGNLENENKEINSFNLHEVENCVKDVLFVNFLLSIERNERYKIYFKHTFYNPIEKTMTYSTYFSSKIISGIYKYLYKDYENVKPKEPREKKRPGRRKNSEKQNKKQ